MRVDRSNLAHRLVALTAGLGFAALTLGVMARLHLAQHQGDHDSGHCSICISLLGHVKGVDPGTAVQVKAGQAVSDPIQITTEAPVLAFPSFRLNTRSPPLSVPV